jgi:hypothetical protein
MYNRVFFPQAALDEWVGKDLVEVGEGVLVIKAERRRYRLVDALRVLSEVSGGGDVYGLVGTVKTVNFLTELGAELLGTSMLIGESGYDVVSGFLGLPIGSFHEHRSRYPSSPDSGAVSSRPEPNCDEELLAQHLLEKL